MNTDIGSVCAFTFESNFRLLNGIYKIQAETSFDQAIKAEINFVQTLYKPVGLTEGDYLADVTRLKSGSILVLEPVSGDALIYIPSVLLATIPDPTIREYFPLSLAISLGIHRGTQAILPLLGEIKDLLETSLGLTDAIQVVTNAKNRQYLTDPQYAVIQAERETRKKKLSPLRVQLKQRDDTILTLQNKLAYYEALMIQLGQPQ